MIKRGDFWIGVLIFLLSLTTVLWGDLSIDITLHDTYFVISYPKILYPTIFWFSINLILYNQLIRIKKSIGTWTQVIHIFLSYITTFIYIFQFWCSILALSGLTRRYFSVIVDLQPNRTFLILNVVTFLAIQVIFIGTVVVKMVKR